MMTEEPTNQNPMPTAAARLALAILARGDLLGSASPEFGSYMAFWITAERLPLGVCLIILKHLVDQGMPEVVPAILQALDQRGDCHPLLDEFRAKWLWNSNKRIEAVELLKVSCEHWKRPYLGFLLEQMTRCLNPEE